MKTCFAARGGLRAERFYVSYKPSAFSRQFTDS